MGSTSIEVWISLLLLNFNQGRTMHLNLADDELLLSLLTLNFSQDCNI